MTKHALGLCKSMRWDPPRAVITDHNDYLHFQQLSRATCQYVLHSASGSGLLAANPLDIVVLHGRRQVR
jgi:hypothetical protein